MPSQQEMRSARAHGRARKRAAEARINRAIVGFQIPMMSIPKLYNALEAAISAGNPDERLQEIVAAFPGVTRGEG